MVRIPAGRDNIEKHEVPGYDAFRNAPWWKRRGWIIVVAIALPLAFRLSNTWFCPSGEEGGLATSENPLFLVPVPFTASEQWRHSLPLFRACLLVGGGLSWYLANLVALGLAWLARRWQYGYQLRESARSTFARSVECLRPKLSVGEHVLFFTRSLNRNTDEMNWLEWGLFGNVMMAALSLGAVIVIGNQIDGHRFITRAVLPWALGLWLMVALIHLGRGIALDTFVCTCLCTGLAVMLQRFAPSVLSACLVSLLCAATLLELVVLLRTPFSRLLVVSNQKTLILSPPRALRRRALVKEFAGNLSLRADATGRVFVKRTDVSPPTQASLVMYKGELPELADALREAHPEWSVDFSAARPRRFLDSLPRAKWLLLVAGVLATGVGVFDGDLFFRGLIVTRLVLPYLKELGSGETQKLYSNCKFILSILPDETIALSMGACAAWELEKLHEAETMAFRAIELTGSPGRTHNAAINAWVAARGEQRALREWNRTPYAQMKYTKEAARELYLASWSLDPRNYSASMDPKLTHVKHHLSRALALDPRTTPEVQRLRQIARKRLDQNRRRSSKSGKPRNEASPTL